MDFHGSVTLLGVLADPGPQANGANEGSDTTHHVDDSGAGEIHKAQACQPALSIPDPACLDGIDHGADHGRVNAVGQNFVRSAMAPETMVAAVAQKTSWKKKLDQSKL